jgi:hypothetical protein
VIGSIHNFYDVGVAPRSEALVLRRVIMHSVPNFGKPGGMFGCCPYLQFFKGGKLVYETASSLFQMDLGCCPPPEPTFGWKKLLGWFRR